MKRIIRFKNQQEYLSFIRQAKQKFSKRSWFRKVRPIDIIHAVACTRQEIQKFKQIRGVRSIEKDCKIRVRLLKEHLPIGLPLFQPAYSAPQSAPSASIPWGIKQVQAPKAWKYSKGKNIHIGVVDTGADYTHPDLKSNLGRGFNCIQSYSAPNDDNGHGTHICGTIAAYAAENGIKGMAPKAILHPVKAFDRSGSAYVSDIIKAIEWCTSNRMDIINMSFGMQTRSQALLDAINNAAAQGIIIVSSAGNEGKKNGIDYPARFKNTIAVGATDKKRRIASFSNRGKQVDFYAPGNKIYSTWLGGKYGLLNGTSMATSHVTGAIALLLAMKPGLTAYQVKRILKLTSMPLISKSGKPLAARKILNAYRAARYLRRRM